MCILVWSECEKRDHDSKEAEDMDNKNQAFEFRKKPTSGCRDDDSERNNSPKEESRMPVLRNVVRVGEDEQTLDQ